MGGSRKAEVNTKHNYGMLGQSLEDQMAADTKDMHDEKAVKASVEEAHAAAESDIANAVKDMADGTKRLEVAGSHCMQVAADHEATLARAVMHIGAQRRQWIVRAMRVGPCWAAWL